MRRLTLATLALAFVGALFLGAECTTSGPMTKTFAAGSLVIPMDNCFQRRDGSSPTAPCNTTADDGIFRAYGLVYFLLKNDVPVYWAIDGATPKTSVTAADLTVTQTGGTQVAQKMSWTDGSFADFGVTASSIAYSGGPFIIDQADAARAVNLLMTHADFTRFKSEAMVDIHKITNSVEVKQVRPLTGPPPKIAILNVKGSGNKTSVDVMYKYAVLAGLSWSCTGNGDCAGGITGTGDGTQGCNLSTLYSYLSSQISGLTCPGSTCRFNSGPGTVYDILCDNDFYSASKTYADTKLAQNDYKLLWAPHWEAGGVTPDPDAEISTPQGQLGQQLKNIKSFVAAGNNVFAECHAIITMEGGQGLSGTEIGHEHTRFQSTAGMKATNVANSTAPAAPAYDVIPLTFVDPAHPDLQIADFSFVLDYGSIIYYHPDRATPATSVYRDSVVHLITQAPSGAACSPTCATGTICVSGQCTRPVDVATTVQVVMNEVARGTVIYAGGHDYASPVNTAGVRIVLNTLFNLGFACADLDTPCNTGALGECAAGISKCGSGGAQQCVPQNTAVTTPDQSDVGTQEWYDFCHSGKDRNCNGMIDDYEEICYQPECTDGATRDCPDGSSVGRCELGTQTCAGGVWGACVGRVTPSPEVCNNYDDDCDGQVDGTGLCGVGYTCTEGICLPVQCGAELNRCPSGYVCDETSSTCSKTSCGAVGICPAGTVCQSGSCVDPCAGITCGPGSSCSGGLCVGGGCAITGCTVAGQVCVEGTCVANPCSGVTCQTGTFCRLGECVRSCAYVTCPAGRHCNVDGVCEADCSPDCATNQICQSGTCVTDPCSGVTCGASQECHDGRCVDPYCSHVACPTGMSCSGGQCTGGTVTAGTQSSVGVCTPSSGGGGCGTGGGGGLASLGMMMVAFWIARRGARPLAPALRRVIPFVAVLLAASGGMACGSKSAGTSCPTCASGETACGSACVDLLTSATNCGICGMACNTAEGFACFSGQCTLDTDNPILTAVSPSSVGYGQTVAFSFTGSGFDTGATVRVTGLTTEATLGVVSSTSGTASIDLSTLTVGTYNIRIVNPNRYVSNSLPVTITDSVALNLMTPGTVKQDGANPFTVTLKGRGFAANSVAVLGGQDVSTTFVGSGELTAAFPAPNTLAVGLHDVTVRNPDGSTSSAVKLSVTEGAPIVDQLTDSNGAALTCVQIGSTAYGRISGSFLYPTSVVRASGGAVSNALLQAGCTTTTDSLGRCTDGRLSVSVNLTAGHAGTYTITVTNPGQTPVTVTPTVEAKVSCP